MSKYTPGTYLIVGFDRVGKKLWTRKSDSQNALGSQHEGISAVNCGDCYSFAVLRVLHNNLIREKQNWD